MPSPARTSAWSRSTSASGSWRLCITTWVSSTRRHVA